MNQILYVQGRTKKISEIKKIIKVFSILIAIFGIVLIAEGGYSLYKGIEHNKVVAAAKIPPTINIETSNDNVAIKVNTDNVISKIEYNWIGEKTTTVEGNGRKNIEEKISLPKETTTLHVKVIDTNDNVAETNKEVTVKNDIQLSVLNNNQIKIVAEDKSGIEKLTYKWNNDDEVEVKPEDDQSKIEKDIDIPVGLNTLNVVVTNTDGVESTKTLDVKGVTKPTINVSRDGDYIVVNITDEAGLSKIIHKLNDGAEQSIPVNGKTITYKQKLINGKNSINIKAYNKNDTFSEFSGDCDF